MKRLLLLMLGLPLLWVAGREGLEILQLERKEGITTPDPPAEDTHRSYSSATLAQASATFFGNKISVKKGSSLENSLVAAANDYVDVVRKTEAALDRLHDGAEAQDKDFLAWGKEQAWKSGWEKERRHLCDTIEIEANRHILNLAGLKKETIEELAMHIGPALDRWSGVSLIYMARTASKVADFSKRLRLLLDQMKGQQFQEADVLVKTSGDDDPGQDFQRLARFIATGVLLDVLPQGLTYDKTVEIRQADSETKWDMYDLSVHKIEVKRRPDDAAWVALADHPELQFESRPVRVPGLGEFVKPDDFRKRMRPTEENVLAFAYNQTRQGSRDLSSLRGFRKRFEAMYVSEAEKFRKKDKTWDKRKNFQLVKQSIERLERVLGECTNLFHASGRTAAKSALKK